MALSKVLTTNRVRGWAGSRSYGRGERYFHGGHVSDLKAVKGRITATVVNLHLKLPRVLHRKYPAKKAVSDWLYNNDSRV